MALMVLCRGEVCWVEDYLAIQLFKDSEQGAIFETIYKVEPIEHSNNENERRVALVKSNALYFFSWNCDQIYTEWIEGIENGQAK